MNNKESMDATKLEIFINDFCDIVLISGSSKSYILTLLDWIKSDINTFHKLGHRQNWNKMLTERIRINYSTLCDLLIELKDNIGEIPKIGLKDN